MSDISSPEERLNELGIILPDIPKPVGNFSLGSLEGNTLYLSGQGPLLENGTLAAGKVGDDVNADEAYYHARRTGLVLISAMKNILGDLNRVKKVRKLFGMVNSTANFAEHPKVMNGCSDLFIEVFGNKGTHARAAVGMASLPGNITIEIDGIITVHE